MAQTTREAMSSLLAKVRRRYRAGAERRRPSWYDGTEKPDTTPPSRYARGKRAVPAPPPGPII